MNSIELMKHYERINKSSIISEVFADIINTKYYNSCKENLKLNEFVKHGKNLLLIDEKYSENNKRSKYDYVDDHYANAVISLYLVVKHLAEHVFAFSIGALESLRK